MQDKADEASEVGAEQPENLDAPLDELDEVRRRELLARLGKLAAYTTPVMLAMMSTGRPAHASE